MRQILVKTRKHIRKEVPQRCQVRATLFDSNCKINKAHWACINTAYNFANKELSFFKIEVIASFNSFWKSFCMITCSFHIFVRYSQPISEDCFKILVGIFFNEPAFLFSRLLISLKVSSDVIFENSKRSLTLIVLVILFKSRLLKYSKTCIRQPLLGPLKSGCLGQVVVLIKYLYKMTKTRSVWSECLFKQ